MTYHNHPLSRPTRLPAHQRHRGFTVIELMVVIGVILILIGIAVVGLNALNAGARADSTKTALETLRAMVTEYEVTSKKPVATLQANIPAQGPPPATPGDPNGLDYGTTPPTYPAPASVEPDEKARNRFFYSPGDHPTQVVISRLTAVPSNRTTLAQLPSKSLLEPGNGVTPNPPVLADGWGNPIIFVPSGGLAGVVLDSGTVTVVANDNRPFWASAGPDGVFGYRDVNGNGSYDAGTDTPGGDDNVYSFQN